MNNQKKRLRLLYKICKVLNSKVTDKEISKLSIEQLQYINHQLNESCYLEACPGSGKTEVVGIKAAYEFNKWESKYSGIAILSFTRNAAKEIRTRISKYAGENGLRYPHYVGTLDSWLHNYILQPFGCKEMGFLGKDGDKSISIIDDDCRAGFLTQYLTLCKTNKGKTYPIKFNDYSFDNKDKLEIDRDIPPDVEVKLKEKKRKFFKDGFVSYRDLEYISYCVVKNNRHIADLISKRFPYIIIDECQDLSYIELCILYNLYKKGVKLHFIGDLNQSINEYRRAYVDHIQKFIETCRFAHRRLTDNYRSNQIIVNACSKLIKCSNTIKGCEPQYLKDPCILWQYDHNSFHQLSNCFNFIVKNNGISFNKSAILARSNQLISELGSFEKVSDESTILFLKALFLWYSPKRNTQELQSSIIKLAKSLCYLIYGDKGNQHKQYCPADLSSKEWRDILLEVLKRAQDIYEKAYNDQTLKLSKWVRLFKEFVRVNLFVFPNMSNNWEEIGARIRSPRGKANCSINNVIESTNKESSIRMSTIHGIKGETLDATLLVSNPDKKSKGGHYSHWINLSPTSLEHVRFAYVAFSRPKHLLIVATPKLKDKEVGQFVNMGFSIQPMPIVS